MRLVLYKNNNNNGNVNGYFVKNNYYLFLMIKYL